LETGYACSSSADDDFDKPRTKKRTWMVHIYVPRHGFAWRRL
jgi:hypothetical protein